MNRDEWIRECWKLNEAFQGASTLTAGLLAVTVGIIVVLNHLFDWRGWGLICFGVLLICAGGKWLLMPAKFPASDTPQPMKERSNASN